VTASAGVGDPGGREAPPASARSRGPLGRESRWAWLFLAPTIIGLAVLSAGPILAALGISLTKWDMLTPPQVVGLDNYVNLLHDDRFLKALRNTTFYTVVSVPLGLALALGLASALNQQIRGIAWIRTAYFLPLVTSATAIALVWLWIYSPTGILNGLLGSLRHRAAALGVRSHAGHAFDHRDERLAGPAGQRDHLPGRPAGDPDRVLRRGQRRRRRAPQPASGRSRSRSSRHRSSSPECWP
jgi:hypothetical protein